MGEIIEVSGEDFRLEDMLAGNPQDELRRLAAIRDGYRRLWERVFEDACLFAGVGIPFNLMSVAGGGEAGSRA